jgi:indole-3-glycerol phosphate synthase
MFSGNFMVALKGQAFITPTFGLYSPLSLWRGAGGEVLQQKQLIIIIVDILQEIVESKRIEVERCKEAVPLDTLVEMGYERLNRNTRSMRKALAASPSGIIAEFKRKSPSKGWLYPNADVAGVLPLYEQGGASACSVLTDEDYFGGSLNDLQKARACVDLPLLRKDFMIDPYQIYQAKIMGADAILLIAACLTTEECAKMAKTAHELQLEVLLEIHSPQELEYLNPCIDMLGVNNRNLGTFHTDINNSFRLIEEIVKHTGGDENSPLLVAESGISRIDSVKELRAAGFRGFLIGETFMKTENPGVALSDFIEELL